MDKIEQLKLDVDELKKSLDELKNNVSISDVEKKNKVGEIKNKAEITKHKIESEITSLSDKTDEKSKKSREEAEALLCSFNETMNLATSILSSPDKHEKQKENKVEDKHEKWIFAKATDWIWVQWNNVWNKDRWSTEPWKNILRTAWFVATWVWAISLAYKWVKNLWNKFFWDNQDDNNETKVSEGSKSSFWDSWLWKIFKWWSLSSTIWWWIHYLYSKRSWEKEDTDQLAENMSNSDKISEEMFQQLLKMEGSQDFVAKSHRKDFWENFVTWPYGMVEKHIDENGKLLKKTLPFKEGERVDKNWAEKNAKAYYDKRAKEWSELLKGRWYEYSQDMLDALVSASWWTTKSVTRLKNFVLSHWDDKDAIFNFMSKFATTAAWNGKTMPGLVIRREFEANWFKWNKEPLSDYQKRYYQDRHYA